MRAAVLLLAVALAGCGSSRALRPGEGERLPVAPYGATATPTPDDLLDANPQARPGRSDELLRNSEERRSDEFDLPPR
jgi:hypothetical protein